MAIVISVQPELTGAAIIDFADDTTDQYVLDASRLQFIEPLGLVQLALLLQWLTARAQAVRFVAPTSSNVGMYLARTDFYTHMPPSLELVNAVDPRSLHRTAKGDVLIPLKRFRTVTEAEELAEEIRQFVQGQALPVPLHSVLWQVASELCDNAVSHSGSPCGAFLAAQSYSGGRRCLAVGDIGIGIRCHLAHNPLYADLMDDEAAIRKAIEPGVTGTREARGWGFEEVQEQAQRTDRAELLIVSGSGRGRILMTGKQRRPSFSTLGKAFPGTLVQLILERQEVTRYNQNQ